MKLKALSRCVIAGSLIALLLFNPSIKAEPEPEPQVATVGCLIVAVGVGIVIVWGLWKICDRALPPPPKPIITNTNIPSTNRLTKLSFELPPDFKLNNDYLIGISNFTDIISMSLESCTNLSNPTWIKEGYIRGLINNGAVTFVTTDVNGFPLMTNTVAIGIIDYKDQSHWVATNDVHSVINTSSSDKKFWRVTP
jgi:hypothetical protein